MFNRIIVALDVPTASDAISLASALNGRVAMFKIGLQLFVAEGPSVVQAVQDAAPDVGIFLDLKLHDIPNTMQGAIRSAKGLGVRFMTVHAGGGVSHLRACVEEAAGKIDILAVTVLTSIGREEASQAGLPSDLASLVKLRASSAAEAGCAGIVCSGQELADLQGVAPNLLRVVPGIRPAGGDVGDQKRIMTPGKAVMAGANYLVIGRPITQANNPAAAAEAISQEIHNAQTAADPE